MPPKKVAKPAAKSKATTAKKKATPVKAVSKPKPAAKGGPATSAAAEFKERLARAEEAARRAAALESQLAGLEGELEQERNDRLAALQRMTELEERLAHSAEAAGGAPVVEDEQRSFLAQQLDAIRDELEQERQAHARTRDRLEAAETTTHDTSEHDRRLHDQIGQLQRELEQREQEIRELQRPAEDLTCPRCRGTMVEFVHLGVTLDRCNDCAGLFFDAGELQEVIKREYPDPEPQTPIVVSEEVVVPEEAPKRKGFFRSLFGRKDRQEA